MTTSTPIDTPNSPDTTFALSADEARAIVADINTREVDLPVGFLTETARLAESADRRLEFIESHLSRHGITRRWAEDLRALRVGFDLKPHCDDFEGSGYRYEILHIEEGAVVFRGDDRAGYHHSYRIPLAYLAAATRPSVLSQYADRYAAEAANQQVRVEADRAARRARDEAEYERLRAALGKDH